VLPFAPVSNAARDAWIGRAISEALTADLSIDRTLSVSTDKDKSVDNANDAIAAAKQAGAQSVVYGTYQNVGENVRVTGQIVDVETGKEVAGIKATGPLQELFTLQDSLVHQIEIRLGRPGLPSPPPQPAQTDSPLPLPDTADAGDGVLGVQHAPHHRGIGWLDEELSRTDEFARDLRTAHDDYIYNAPSPFYYGPAWGVPIAGLGGGVPFGFGGGVPFGFGGAPLGAVPFAPNVAPPGWRPATPYYPSYYYPPVTVSVTTSDGDGWNGRTQTQGGGIVGGGMRATPKQLPYQVNPQTQYYRPSAATPRPSNAPQAVTNQVGNRQMPSSRLPDSPEVAARRTAPTPNASQAQHPSSVERPGTPPRPPVRTSPVVSQQQQQSESPAQNARR